MTPDMTKADVWKIKKLHRSDHSLKAKMIEQKYKTICSLT